jgi:hypothetical protein
MTIDTAKRDMRGQPARKGVARRFFDESAAFSCWYQAADWLSLRGLMDCARRGILLASDGALRSGEESDGPSAGVIEGVIGLCRHGPMARGPQTSSVVFLKTQRAIYLDEIRRATELERCRCLAKSKRRARSPQPQSI